MGAHHRDRCSLSGESISTPPTPPPPPLPTTTTTTTPNSRVGQLHEVDAHPLVELLFLHPQQLDGLLPHLDQLALREGVLGREALLRGSGTVNTGYASTFYICYILVSQVSAVLP